MRWKARWYGLKQRIIRRFALFPFLHRGAWRWLETYYMLQKRNMGNFWYNYCWATKEEYLAWCEEMKNKEAQ